MRAMWCGLVLVGLTAAAAAAPARAGDKPANEPTVVIRVKSLDTVLQNLKLIATVLGREQAADDIRALIQAKVGEKGLQGIDLKRPVGAYVRFGKELEDLSGAVLIPVADEAAFISLLDNLGMSPTKGAGGIYTLQTKQNIELYLRFAKQYAYVSGINTENLSDKNLIDPQALLRGAGDSLLSIDMRLDQVPDAAKLLAVTKLDEDLDNAQKQAVPNETELQKGFRIALLKQVAETTKNVLKDSQRLHIDVSLPEGQKDLAIKVALSAVPGTELAKSIQAAGQEPSPFAGLLAKGAAFRGAIDVSFPADVNRAFARAFDEAALKGIADVSSPAKRKQAEALVETIRPTIRAARLDAFLGLAGPKDGHYLVLAALRLKDGDRFGTVVRQMIEDELKDMPAEQRQKIQLDADSAGAVKIHRFELPPDPKTGKVLDGLPGDPNLYVAFRKDAALLAIGPGALPALKEAIANEQTGAAPLFLFDFHVGKMAPTLAKSAEQKDLAAKVFSGDKGDGRIRVVLESGAALTLRVHVGLDVLEFFAKMKGKE